MYFMMSIGCLLSSSLAEAEEAVVSKPGIMCSSSEALAILTLHGGNSRTHREKPEAVDLDVARRGGCQDLQIGQRLSVLERFQNTAIVVQPAGPWLATADRFVVPLIDLTLARPDGGVRVPDAAETPADTLPASPEGGWFIADSEGGCTESFSPAIEAKMLHDNGINAHVENTYDSHNVPVKSVVSHDVSGTDYAYVFYATKRMCLADVLNTARRTAAGR